VKASWSNLFFVEVCWAALAYYFGKNWGVRLILFLLLNALLLWGWRRSQAQR
jgi:putative copper export protein